MKLSTPDREFYEKIRLLASLPSRSCPTPSDDDIYELCQYSRFDAIKQHPMLLAKLASFREKHTNNSCLHIAAVSSNKNLVQNLVQGAIIDPNTLNAKGENALMTTLLYNEQQKGQHIAAFLLRHTNASHSNWEGKQAHELEQPIMNQSRARLIERLRKLSVQ